MLASRFARPSSLLARPFSSSAVVHRSPSIRDITPDSAAEFNARQKEFRENLEVARKRKEQQESQSVNASASASPSPSSPPDPPSSPSPALRDRFREYATAPAAPHASKKSSLNEPVVDAAAVLDNKALGSLAMHRSLGDERLQDQSPKRGALSSLIYGTKEGQQLDKDIERSYSQVLARGKYVHSIVFHEVKPDKVDEYVDLVGQWYPRVAGTAENRVNLVGSWRTQVGDNDTFGNYLAPIFNILHHRQRLADQVFSHRYSAYLGVPAI